MRESTTTVIQKIVWSMAPIIWGSFVWFMSWGLGSTLAPYYSLNYISQVIAAALVVNYFFGPALQNAPNKYPLQFFGHSFWVPPWRFFLVLAVTATCLSATPIAQFDLISSLICGVIVSAIYELLQREGHFGFSFMLGVVVYKTQRIEISMLLHILSNLLRYTIPTYMFISLSMAIEYRYNWFYVC